MVVAVASFLAYFYFKIKNRRHCISKGLRVIIARFLRYSDRQRIAKLARSLKDDQISIYPDFPKSIQESRRRQIPKLKAAKQGAKTAYFHPSKPDLLYVDGVFIPE